MFLFILVVLLFLILSLFISAGVLFGVSKIFKIEEINYKKTFKIISWLFLSYFIINIILGLVNKVINLGVFLDILYITAYLAAFEYLLMKYYKISWKRVLGLFSVFFLIIYLLMIITIVPFRLYVVSPFVVSGYSMSPSFNRGNYLLIEKFDRNFSRGDVVVYKYPRNTKLSLVHRIIGIPLDNIKIQNGSVYINGNILEEKYSTQKTPGDVSVILKKGEYFVLGDNRNKSFDSRNFGVIPKSDIEGKVYYKVF